MADPTAIVPYYDPFDDPQFPENILVFDESSNLGLTGLPINAEHHFFNHSIFPQSDDHLGNAHLAGLPINAEHHFFNHSIFPQSDDHLGNAHHPLADPFVRGMCNPTTGNSQAGPSEFHGETSNRQEVPQMQNLDFGGPVQLPIWPVPPVPYSCTCCQVLREIIHSKGLNITKLEIHGRLGMICHAVLENRHGGDNWNAGSNHQMFDFCKKSIESVREFLVQYCEDRKQAGYTMLQDPLQVFYGALCVGLYNNNGDDDKYFDTDDFFQASPEHSAGGCDQMRQPEHTSPPGAESEEARLPKSSLAAQRERTGKLTLKDFIGYFHLPIDDAAKKMNVCPTVMKKICRRDGLYRWPYRKIKSIERKISIKRAISLAASSDAEERAQARADIESLQQEIQIIIAALAS